jgi:hypothetical protein
MKECWISDWHSGMVWINEGRFPDSLRSLTIYGTLEPWVAGNKKFTFSSRRYAIQVLRKYFPNCKITRDMQKEKERRR